MKLKDMIETVVESRHQLILYEACIESEGEELEGRKEEENTAQQLDVIYADTQKVKKEAVEVRKRIDELALMENALTDLQKALN